MGERRRLSVAELYRKWAGHYDNPGNLAIFLEENEIQKELLKLKGKKILDYGCGTGRWAVRLAKNNYVRAVDFSSEMLEVAKAKAEKEKVNINFEHKDILEFSPKEKYGLIISSLVLDHIKNLRKAVEIIDRSAKKGTELIITNIPAYQIYKKILTEGKTINQFYHPLEEYLSFLSKKGWVLEHYKELVFNERHRKMGEFKNVDGALNEPYAVLTKWRKIK